jgi:hypothetical protein
LKVALVPIYLFYPSPLLEFWQKSLSHDSYRPNDNKNVRTFVEKKGNKKQVMKSTIRLILKKNYKILF